MDPNLDGLLWNGRGRDTEGTDKIYGVVPAVVIKIQDDKDGRHRMGAVQVRFPWLMDTGTPQDITPWARCVSFAGGTSSGQAPAGWITTPQIGDEVLVGFENGDINVPYVLGQLTNPGPASASAPVAAGPGSGGGGSGPAAGDDDDDEASDAAPDDAADDDEADDDADDEERVLPPPFVNVHFQHGYSKDEIEDESELQLRVEDDEQSAAQVLGSLAELGQRLAENPDCRYEVQGHADRSGDATKNMDLSCRRAESVIDYLVKNGASRGQLVRAWYGESAPMDPDRPDGQKVDEDRRAECHSIAPRACSCGLYTCPATPNRREPPNTDEEVDVRGTLVVAVTNTAATPVEGARVEVAGQETKEATSGADGDAELEEILKGRYDVTVEKDGFVPFTGSADLNDERVVYEVELEALAMLEVRVTDGADPLDGVLVKVTSAAGGADPGDKTTDASGLARFDDVAREAFKVEASKAGFEPKEKDVTVDDDVVRVDIALQRASATLRVKVIDKDGDPARMDVSISGKTVEISGPKTDEQETNDAGVATFEEVPAGTVQVKVPTWMLSPYREANDTVTMSAGSDQDIQIELERKEDDVNCLVLDDGGNPVNGALVTLTGPKDVRNPDDANGTTNANGICVIGSRRAGGYEAWAQKQFYYDTPGVGISVGATDGVCVIQPMIIKRLPLFIYVLRALPIPNPMGSFPPQIPGLPVPVGGATVQLVGPDPGTKTTLNAPLPLKGLAQFGDPFIRAGNYTANVSLGVLRGTKTFALDTATNVPRPGDALAVTEEIILRWSPLAVQVSVWGMIPNPVGAFPPMIPGPVPVAGANVTAAGAVTQTRPTNGDGWAVFAMLPDGVYTISVPGYANQPANLLFSNPGSWVMNFI